MGGMGLTIAMLPDKASCQGVSIESRIETLRTKLKTKKSAAQYARAINLFLVCFI